MTIDVESNTTKESKGVIVIYTCSPTGNAGKKTEELYNLWEKQDTQSTLCLFGNSCQERYTNKEGKPTRHKQTQTNTHTFCANAPMDECCGQRPIPTILIATITVMFLVELQEGW